MLVKLTVKHLPQSVGNKAVNLRRLVDRGFRVPRTWIIPWDVCEDVLAEGKPAIPQELRQELTQSLDPATAYAIRSSANIEDDLRTSFAGQFKTLLNVKGIENILQAVREVWASAHSNMVKTYQEKTVRMEQTLHMAVIIQEMIEPVYSGVAFSRNPLTGLDEVVIEAVQGEGTRLVQDGITPLRWVDKNGKWIESPQEPQAPDDFPRRVAAGTRQLSQILKQDIDLEWVFDGQEVFWLQMREITGLGELNIYSNRISRDMIPGAIKPLIWSVNIPLVNTVWIRLLTEVIGKKDIQPEHLAKSFYYRTYFNMGAFGRIFERLGMPANGLEAMMGVAPKDPDRPAFKPGAKTMRLLPRMVVFAWDKWNFTSLFRKHFPGLQNELAVFRLDQIARMDEKELLAYIDRLYPIVGRIAYFNVVIPLLMALYNHLLNSQLKKQGVDAARFNLMEGMEALQDYDPNIHLSRLHQAYLDLSAPLQEKLCTCRYTDLTSTPGLETFRQQFDQFLSRFGHFSNSGNDFSVAPWRETPDIMLTLVRDFKQVEVNAEDRISYADLSTSRGSRWRLGLLYRRARQYRLFREQISSLYTLGYGMFRPFFLALGAWFVQRGFLSDPADIFYLNFKDIRRQVASPGEPVEAFETQVAQHKMEIEKVAGVILPTVIYGDDAPPIQPTSSTRLSGIPTSRGYYCGKLKVVHGIEDFHKLKERDILVIPFTDVGWTPLFARAGAVVSESGGMLSHSSIVAREYNIPAVVSVQGAMQLIDGTRIAVDGYRGEVVILEDTAD